MCSPVLLRLFVLRKARSIFQDHDWPLGPLLSTRYLPIAWFQSGIWYSRYAVSLLLQLTNFVPRRLSPRLTWCCATAPCITLKDADELHLTSDGCGRGLSPSNRIQLSRNVDVPDGALAGQAIYAVSLETRPSMHRPQPRRYKREYRPPLI